MIRGLAEAQPLPQEPLDRVSKLLLLVALLVPTMSCFPRRSQHTSCAHVTGVQTCALPFWSVLALLAFNHPRLCLPSFAILITPLLRVMDAAFLRRFDVTLLGDHSMFVMNLLSAWLVSFAAVALLTSPHWRKLAYWLALATILFVNASIYYEALGFEKFTRIPGRLSGFPVDPNDGPITSCLMLGICFTLQPAFWKNLALAAFATPAIALTMSRSGMAIFAFMVGLYVLFNLRRHFTGLVLISLACVPLAIGGVAVLAQRTSSGGLIKDENTRSRLHALYELDVDKLQ